MDVTLPIVSPLALQRMAPSAERARLRNEWVEFVASTPSLGGLDSRGMPRAWIPDLYPPQPHDPGYVVPKLNPSDVSDPRD